jgi:hypothetical protein
MFSDRFVTFRFARERTFQPMVVLKLAINLLLVVAAVGIAGFARDVAAQSQPGTPATSVFINPKEHGAIADCGSHPLSSVHASLAAAQAVYPFITSLSQQVDYAALKAASDAAFGADGAEHGYKDRALNKPLYLPGGCYNLGDDTWLVRNAVGIHIYGAGRLVTRIVSSNTAFRTDGLWYSRIQGVEFASLTSNATVAMDIDGNVPGHPYDTRGVQGNTFSDLLIDGGGSLYGFALCRQGQSGGQCSENLYLDLHLNNASFAVYYQFGFNALNNTFVGGNFQNYPKNGVFLVAGSLNLFSVGFQSTYQYRQILNDGFDINASSAGVYERIIVDGCRTESLRFYNGAFSQYGILRGVQQLANVAQWSASTALNPDVVIIRKTNAGEKLFRVTAAGITGEAQPVWPSSGVVKDGTVTWSETDFEVVHLVAGEISGSYFQVGKVVRPAVPHLLDHLSYQELTQNPTADDATSAKDGTQIYCKNCDTPIAPGAVCSSTGDKAGAEAHKIRGAWRCF